jgi:hypothetical protein
MAKEKRLKKNTVVTTEMTNIGFDIAMKKIGVKVKKVQVGDRYVVEEMVKGGYNLGGEQSGHVIFLDHIIAVHQIELFGPESRFYMVTLFTPINSVSNIFLWPATAAIHVRIAKLGCYSILPTGR